jgi:G3E family GTPase
MGTYPIYAAPAHSPAIRSFHVDLGRPKRALLERFLAVLVDLRGADLLRVKGVVALEGGQSVLVQGVRHVFDRLRPVELPATGLAFIANEVNRDEVEALWLAMSNLKGKS